jgi:superfamily II DNA or RNA helicase
MNEIAQTASPIEEVELEATRETLLSMAKGRFGRVAPARIVDHVLRMTEGADWPVRKAALEALKRRYGFAERDAIRIRKRPEGGGVLGTYRVARSARSGPRGRGESDYEMALLSLEPLTVSCGCADFLRSSLGLCKHALVVLHALERTGARSRLASGPDKASRRARLSWSPLHPLTGAADRLARLELVPGTRPLELDGFARGRPAAVVLRDPLRRLAFITALERAIARGRVDAEPAVPALLAEERENAELRADGRALAGSAHKSLGSLLRKLYPYQRLGVQRVLEQGRLLLADDMGLGKTTQAIAACHVLFHAGRVKKGLLIVPSALKSQWAREWAATTRTPLSVVDGSPSERDALYKATTRGFLVIGYEQFLRDFDAVRRFSPELVVLDEAQRIKNWATKSAAYVKALAPRYRLVLTGTPMENRFDELASIMDFVDGAALEPKWRLVPWHSVNVGDGGRGVAGARNLDTLRARLSHAMLRRVRRDVLSQLPSRTDTRVPVEMTPAQQAEHEELRPAIARLLSVAARRALTHGEFLRLMQLLTTQRIICNGLAQLRFDDEWPRCNQARRPTPALLESLCAPKLSALRGLIEQVVLAQGRKAVVFSQWRSMLRLCEWAVRDLLAAAGQRAVFFTGAESNKLRERAIIELHDDPATTVMFLSDAGGVGLNLQRAATCCINLELPWNPAVLEQRIGRIYRLGQAHPIDVYNLVTDAGIEARIAQLVADKRAVFTSLFDGTTDAVRFDGDHSFLEGVKKLVDAPALPEIASDDALDAVTEPEPEDTTQRADAEPNGAAQPALLSQPPATLVSALSRIALAPLPNGGLRIDAPPELASPLADLLEGLARSLRASAGPSPARDVIPSA